MNRTLSPETTKLDPLTPRVFSCAQTIARVQAVAKQVPITRLADLTPLGTGHAPVYCAVTPLAQDLTTHLGKGATDEAAQASALMEAVERVSAEVAPGARLRGSFAQMRKTGAPVLDPRLCDLPGDTAFAPDVELDWLKGRCLLADQPVLLPADLVESPPREGLLGQADTNGLASGNSWHEAVVHGLGEVIERDAASQHVFSDLFADQGMGARARRLHGQDLPDMAARAAADVCCDGRYLILDDLTLDIPVPVVRAFLVDPAYPGENGPVLRVFVGYGCDPNAEVATTRAITEAAQSYLAVVQGARDSFNDQPMVRRAAARRNMQAALEPRVGAAFTSLKNFACNDLAGDLAHILDALRQAGVDRVLVFDLTRPDLGLPVVRVRVPGLSQFLADRSRVGDRCTRWLL